MPRTLPEIRAALVELVDRWKDYDGTEKAASQTFLNQLVSAFTGAPDALAAGARFEEFGDRNEGSGFMDLYWPDVAIIEMKAPSRTKNLHKDRAQVIDYWRNSADPATKIEAPRYLVLCSFQWFEIWQPYGYPPREPDYAPLAAFSLEELPDQVESLLFLAGRAPVFTGASEEVSSQAAQLMVDLYFSLLDREAASAEDLRRFILQTVWALFAEDLRIIEGLPIGTLARALLKDQTRSSANELTGLYQRMNIREDGARNPAGLTPIVPYVNGALFASAAPIHLLPAELETLIAASDFDWEFVNPTVFGALLEGCLGHDRRWELGAHYTSEADIRKIVEPVVVRPWMTRIDAATTYTEASRLLDELCRFKVLDPAMGCSNFLVISYRELRQLEAHLHEKLRRLAAAEGRHLPLELSWYPISNIQGIEIDPFAVEIAKATLWMTHALEVRKLGSGESPLPLPPLENLVCADALKTEWPDTDVIIGNPPFHGDRNLRGAVGDDYLEWLKDEFGVGVKDHCVYFFLRAHENLKPGHRAGMVATKTISQNKNRDASLVRMVEDGIVITDAISSQKWSGEAAVHVSIICWQAPPVDASDFFLDGKPVSGITPSLREGSTHQQALVLAGNRDVCFIGNVLNGEGFILTGDEAKILIAADPKNSQVVKPFITGRDILKRPDMGPARWVIDFGTMELEEAARFAAPMKIVRERVKPERDLKSDKRYREVWWQFGRPVPSMRAAVEGLERFALTSIVGKRLILTWSEPGVVPSHACAVFAFTDDYWFGIFSSRLHEIWALHNNSSLGATPRYTPSTAFETFPLPDPSPTQRHRIAEIARNIVMARTEACASTGYGLTKVYNLMDEGGFAELARATEELNRAVMDAYGLDWDLLDRPSDLMKVLYQLNAATAANPGYHPFGDRSGIEDEAAD
jgi:hypothetical protein